MISDTSVKNTSTGTKQNAISVMLVDDSNIVRGMMERILKAEPDIDVVAAVGDGAQDEATSVVWGMPGAVATEGLCTDVLPLKEIGPKIRVEVMKV